MNAVTPVPARPWRERLQLYARLTRLDKPIGTLLLLWPTLGALWIAAGGWPGLTLIAVFCVGTLLMRSAGCAINDVADRDFDGRVKRTAARVVAARQVSVREALIVAAVLAAAAAATLPLLNRAAFELSLVALAVAASYPFFKRFFPLPQAYLGIAFSFGIPMAFAAVQGSVGALGWALFAANLFWVVAYDTEYAMVDRDDDLRIGIRSSAILFGRGDLAAVAICYAVYLAALLAIGERIGAGAPFLLGWAGAAACAGYHLWLIRKRERDACFRAFLHNHWLGCCVFAGIAADFALR
ncbi:MAG TPA: 4-hydroxybenzoate octaprenyltransferase [Burkholderiaceae bacterium]